MKILILCLGLLISVSLSAQNPERFGKEVQELIAADSSINRTDIILFTGSSSIRLWKDIASSFPEHNVLNRGFGGSEMSDLVYFSDKLILPYKPQKIFIYEGDNDLNAGKSVDQILLSADSLLTIIRKNLPPEIPVIFISPKPSVARWGMKDKYVSFNTELKAWTRKHENVEFADVWTPMVDRQGNVRTDLFVEDRLHMNKTGYEIWARVLRKYLR
ncbi:MAG TPA: GDSL-type esterase/lipase family protein [Ohtaekwangia sp.]